MACSLRYLWPSFKCFPSRGLLSTVPVHFLTQLIFLQEPYHAPNVTLWLCAASLSPTTVNTVTAETTSILSSKHPNAPRRGQPRYLHVGQRSEASKLLSAEPTQASNPYPTSNNRRTQGLSLALKAFPDLLGSPPKATTGTSANQASTHKATCPSTPRSDRWAKVQGWLPQPQALCLLRL